MRPGDTDCCPIRFAVRQCPFERILIRLRERNRASGARACMDSFLHIHAEVGRPFEFLRGHGHKRSKSDGWSLSSGCAGMYPSIPVTLDLARMVGRIYHKIF